MSDVARPVAPEPDSVEARHTLTVREVEKLLVQAGVPRSHRHVLRLCQSGLLDAVKIPGPSGDEWFVAPSSVPKAIGDLKQIEVRRARPSALRPDMSNTDGNQAPENSNEDTAGHDRPEQAVSGTNDSETSARSRSDMARRSPTRDDIYEHPYVKRLEERCDKLETKLDAQVRRTEEIQIRSQEKLLELQRMTAVGQSQTLAEFMLRAKDWVLGQGSDTEKTPDNESIPGA